MAESAHSRSMRTCVACRVQHDKQAMTRFVRISPSEVVLDASGRKAGRGAYVCSDACFEAALKTKKLERALKIDLSDDQKRALREACALQEGVTACGGN